MRCINSARIWPWRSRRPTCGRVARPAGATSRPPGSWHERLTGWAHSLPERDRRAALDRGVKAGELATKIDATKPEGHFWLAANMGTLAESYGLTQGIKYRGRIKDALLRVLAINPAWMQGSADRALGWWYHKVPGLFGGSEATAEEHLRKALAYNPRSTGHAVLSLRSRGRARPQGRSADAAPTGPRCAHRSRLGAGRSRLQAESARSG